MSAGPAYPNPPDAQAVLERTQWPGLLLLLVGVFNLLLSLWLLFAAIQSFRISDEEMERRLDQMRRMPGLGRALEEDPALTPARLRSQSGITSTVWAVLSLWAAVLILLAGLRMRALRSYGMVLMGALLACVPCVSCTSCCCLGPIAGIWAIAVLLDPEVRLLFR